MESTAHDPDDYWPDASLFRGNNLRVAPDPASAHFSTILLTIGPLVIYAIGTAIIMPAITILVLDSFTRHRGTATSMQGFIQMLINAGVAGIAVPLLHTQRADFVIGQAVFLSLAGALWYASCRRCEAD